MKTFAKIKLISKQQQTTRRNKKFVNVILQKVNFQGTGELISYKFEEGKSKFE